MSLLQIFSEMRTQRSGFGQNSCVRDKQACVSGSLEFNKHPVLKIFMINGLKFEKGFHINYLELLAISMP